jgi:hypothetical protein
MEEFYLKHLFNNKFKLFNFKYFLKQRIDNAV